MSLQRYLQFIEKRYENLSPAEQAELISLHETVDGNTASKDEFLKIVEFEDYYKEELGTDSATIFDNTYNRFLELYSEINSTTDKYSFSEQYCGIFDGRIDPCNHDFFETLVDAAIENADESLQAWILNSYGEHYGDEMFNPECSLWQDPKTLSLASKIAAIYIYFVDYNVDDFMFRLLWMGYTKPLSTKQRQFLDSVRPLDVDIKLSQPQATDLLASLDEAADHEGHAHIIHSLLHTGTKKRNRITDSELANAIVAGAIKNESVDIVQFANTSQSAYLLPAPFKTLKNAMKEGNERAALILRTILTDKSWKRLTQPRKRGRLARIWRKLTGQTGKFIPKPRRK